MANLTVVKASGEKINSTIALLFKTVHERAQSKVIAVDQQGFNAIAELMNPFGDRVYYVNWFWSHLGTRGKQKSSNDTVVSVLESR